MIVSLDSPHTLEELITNNYEKTVLYFSAKWCGPCKTIHPHIEEFANSNENNNKILFIKIDIDEHEECSEDFGSRDEINKRISELKKIIQIKDS